MRVDQSTMKLIDLNDMAYDLLLQNITEGSYFVIKIQLKRVR